MHRHTIASGIAVAAALALAAPATSLAAAPYDFNGDGRQDLALGLPWASRGEDPGVGAVAIVHGSPSRLFGASRLLRGPALGLGGEHRYAAVGTGIASGDFDGDGTADLAVGAPGEGRSGTVAVVYGPEHPGSRTATFAGPATFGRFGASLTAGDIDRDGFDDLVVGDTAADPRADADSGSGAIHILHGGPGGLTPATEPLARPRADWAAFGMTLALGDLQRDGGQELVEGATGSPEWTDDPPVPGHLSVSAHAHPPVEALAGSLEGGPSSLAIGDVNGDGWNDVVAGVPINAYAGEDQRRPAGAVRIYLGGARGLARRPVVLDQRSAGVPGSNEPRDLFGASVAVTRVDRDRYADIVIGAPGEDKGRGRVTIVRGGPGGYSRRGAIAFGQDTPGIPGVARPGHRFGDALSVLDLDGSDRGELVVGAPGDDRGTGSITGIRTVRGQLSVRTARRMFIRSLGVESLEPYAFPATRLGRQRSS